MFIKRLSEATKPLGELKPAAILAQIVLLIPDEYKANRQYPFCIEMLEQGEWGLALASLLDFADETGYSFSHEIWHGLAVAADKMQMSTEAKFCREQL